MARVARETGYLVRAAVRRTPVASRHVGRPCTVVDVAFGSVAEDRSTAEEVVETSFRAAADVKVGYRCEELAQR